MNMSVNQWGSTGKILAQILIDYQYFDLFTALFREPPKLIGAPFFKPYNSSAEGITDGLSILITTGAFSLGSLAALIGAAGCLMAAICNTLALNFEYVGGDLLNTGKALILSPVL